MLLIKHGTSFSNAALQSFAKLLVWYSHRFVLWLRLIFIFNQKMTKFNVLYVKKYGSKSNIFLDSIEVYVIELLTKVIS